MSRNFWKGYMFFFIFLFPMIFEYMPMIGASGADDDLFLSSSPVWAFTCLGIGAAGWILFIFFYYKGFVRPLIGNAGRVEKTSRDGVPVTATIKEKRLIADKGSYQQVELEIVFRNLSGTMVRMPYELNDIKPQEQRFEKGKTIRMRIDPALQAPAMIPEGITVATNTSYAVRNIGFFLGLIIFSVGYLVFSYWLQNNGYGWRFLHFWHPWVTIPLWGLFFGVLLDLVILKLAGDDGGFMGLLMGGSAIRSSAPPKELVLVLKGKMARARVLNAQQTGTFINEQPQVKFELEFADDKGQLRRVTFKKIISLLNMGSVQQQERMILYLPDDPLQVVFAEEYLPGAPVAGPISLN